MTELVIIIIASIIIGIILAYLTKEGILGKYYFIISLFVVPQLIVFMVNPFLPLVAYGSLGFIILSTIVSIVLSLLPWWLVMLVNFGIGVGFFTIFWSLVLKFITYLTVSTITLLFSYLISYTLLR